MTDDNTMQELLTELQAAELLQVSDSWLRQARYRQEGPPYIVLGSKMIRYERDELMAWARSQKPEATDEE